MLLYRTTAEKGFWEFDFIIKPNLSDILPLFCTSTWPSHHVSKNQESVIVFQFSRNFNLLIMNKTVIDASIHENISPMRRWF